MSKLINATDAKVGTVIKIDGVPCTVKTLDKSKSGKHGAAKCRIEAINIIDGKKKIIAVPGHERFEVPMINKKKGQILSIEGEKASIMDLDSYETLDVILPENMKEEVKLEDQVEYWEIEGTKIIKRKN
ncbi:MAG: translation initiation factor IF-5A [Nanoarchaeota archaeon]|nr:translation initiation factor IF-5A [Nanoarchaeota archaeon]